MKKQESPGFSRGGQVNIPAVAQAAAEVQAATARLRQAVAQAHAAGETVAEIARTAGVGRQTIYRWIALDDGMDTQHPPVRESLRDAILLMSSLVAPYHARQLRDRADGDTDMQLRALRMGRSWVPDEAWRELSAEDRGVLAVADDAENRVRKARGNAG